MFVILTHQNIAISFRLFRTFNICCCNRSFCSSSSPPPLPRHFLHHQTANGEEKCRNNERWRWKPNLWRLLWPWSKDGGGGQQRLLLLWLWSWNRKKQGNRQQSLLWIKNCAPGMVDWINICVTNMGSFNWTVHNCVNHGKSYDHSQLPRKEVCRSGSYQQWIQNFTLLCCINNSLLSQDWRKKLYLLLYVMSWANSEFFVGWS